MIYMYVTNVFVLLCYYRSLQRGKDLSLCLDLSAAKNCCREQRFQKTKTSKRERPLLLNRRKELIFLHNASLFVYRPLQSSLTTANDVREVS